ncbi:MAG: histidine kinase dimerization/phospho-acceptor domain-containing protein, partial [Gimesia chilikensis]
MKSYGKYWVLVVLLLFMSCADNLLVTSQLASPMLALAASLVASLVGWAWLVKSLQKDRDQISACLRNPELLRPELKQKNFFGNLFAEAIQKIEESDTELVSTTQVKTMLKARLNALSKKEALMESVLDHLETGVLIFDAQHTLEFSNQAASTFVIPEADRTQNTSESGLALNKALSSDVVIPEIASLLTKTIERKDATLSRRSEFQLTGLDFQSHFRAIATNLLDENQALLGTVIVVENIGEENNEKERHAEFVSSVAHELKTPMAGIKAYIEMLLDGDCEEDEAEELYGFINEQIDRLTRLVNSMLNLARI